MSNARLGTERLQEIFRERASLLSEVPTLEESGERISILSFRLGGELYGVELTCLAETRQSVPLRHVPCAPPHLVGIINLRGELLPVVDICPILGLPQQQLHTTVPALLVLSLKENKITFVVDRAENILTFQTKEIHPPPLSLESERAHFIRGVFLVDGRALSLLEMDNLLKDPRLAVEDVYS